MRGTTFRICVAAFLLANAGCARHETIEATGTILGVGIGTTLEEAHERLDRYVPQALREDKDADSGDRDAAQRGYWKLEGTDFQWIVAKAGRDGKIFELSASVRPDRAIPFEKIGDLSRAAVNTEAAVTWNLSRPGVGNVKLVAKGPGRRATSIYMLNLEMARR